MNASSSVPVLTTAEAIRVEADLFDGNESAEWAAMQRAGAAVAAAVLRDFEEIGGFPPSGRILVLAGKGHNAGDALIAVTALLGRYPSAHADIVFVFGERALRPLALRAWQELGRRAVERAQPLAAVGPGPYALSLDGIFGLQYHPPLPDVAAAALRSAAAAPVSIRAAVDVPSGLDEPDAFAADFTYATGSVKDVLFACPRAGRLRYLDLGFFGFAHDPEAARQVLTVHVLDPLAALRPAHSDKRAYGHVMIIGGSRGYPGAVLMNALAALHSGVGLVTVFAPESLVPAYAARAPEAMWVGWPETAAGSLAHRGLPLLQERLGRADALALGSGLGRDPETLALAAEIAGSTPGPLLLDADALQPNIVQAAGPRALLTPHAGEFARIAGGAELEAFCAGSGAVVVLKGPITRIAGGSRPSAAGQPVPDERVYHSFFGGPVLSRGGSGDVLAGLIAGQLAQAGAAAKAAGAPAGVDPRVEAACRGAAWHGLAADALARSRGQTAVTVTQLIECLPAVLRVDLLR